MTTTHTITYDYQDIATVQIDDKPETLALITEMNEFWGSHSIYLREEKGDQIMVFLKRLALYVAHNGRAPDGERDEGWYPLDGSRGILVKNCYRFELDRDQIEIDSV